ncbi:MAG: glutamine synthetase [Thermomicrobiales bacterium]|nr:glutamine synthetase [Thermomicrobiales bacterium]
MVVELQPAASPDRADAIEHAIERVGQADVRLVDLQFSDIAGGARAMTIPADLARTILTHGYRFDGSAVTGGLREIELDLYLMPDPTTLRLASPVAGAEPRGQLTCSIIRRDGQPFAGDPRSILERALTEARAEGYDYRVAVELEYYLFRPEAVGVQVADEAGYFGIGQEHGAAARDEIVATLQAMGIRVGGAHHETGPGQEELDLLPEPALRMADQVLAVRQVIRAVAGRHGLRANFMPKPLADAPGSGMHVFQRLLRSADGTDALRGDDDELSPMARHVIAGQLAHAPAMAAVLCPGVNSYKRLAAGHRAPRHATWARLSQASLIRVPSWSPAQGSHVELELRLPDNLANPYLALTVALACALDGTRIADEPPTPLDENLVRYDDAELERLGVPRLPATLGDALEAFAEDDLVRDALGDYVSGQLLYVKRAEWNDYSRHVSSWEYARYGE